MSRVINSGAVGALIAVMEKDPNDDDETDSDSEGGRGFRGGAGEDDEDDDDDAVIKRVLQASGMHICFVAMDLILLPMAWRWPHLVWQWMMIYSKQVPTHSVDRMPGFT